jgi:flagellar biosynthesis/type III secretory pathway protein FliH
MSEGFRLWAEAERKEGKLEGMAEGKAEGIAEGRIEGIDESKEKFIQYLIENGKTKEEAVSEIDKLFS